MTKPIRKKTIIKMIEKIPVGDRTELQHQILIKYYGSVRDYMLSIAPFKDVEIFEDE